jgi:hypothetical protein
MKKNWPFIIITGFGISATLIFLYFFVYGMAVNTVRSTILLEKAYPNTKPEEYINELIAKAEKNELKIIGIKKEEKYYIIQLVNDNILEKTASLSPKFTPLSVVTVVIYDLRNGTGIVGNNPYIWDIISPDSYIDDIAENFSNQLSDIFDSIYWEIKKKKEKLN